MLDSLFDPPWYLIVGLVLAGLVLLYHGLARQLPGLKWVGVAALVFSVAIWAAGRIVETGSERVRRETRELVAAADRRDWKAFAALLDPQVRFEFYGGREQLTAGAAATVDRVGVKNISVGAFDVKAEPGGYAVTFTATADIDAAGQRAPTDWRFFWAKDRASDGYLLYRIEPLPNAQFGTDPVTSRLARP